MLRQLAIRNLALIDSLDLEFGPGLNIVTGETGAGKSVLIGALSLVLGERADRDKIRRGADRCEISAFFEPPAGALATVEALLDDLGLPPCDEGNLLVRRVIGTKGSRCFINGSPATAQSLRKIGDNLIEVHGPYEHQALLQPARQLELLDAYANLGKERTTSQKLWQTFQEAEQAVEEARKDAPSPERRDVLQFQLNEIKSAELTPDEEPELRRRHQLAANAGELLNASKSAAAVLNQNNGITDKLQEVVRYADTLASLDTERGEPLAQRLDLLHEEIIEISREFNNFCQHIETNPAELNELDARIALFQKLKRKYGGSIGAAIEHGNRAKEALHRMDNFDEWIAECEAKARAAEEKFTKHAKKLSRLRKKAAPKLAEQISERLRHLGFASAEFAVTVDPNTAMATGLDKADMHFAPNPGEGVRPLRQIASSGEIARVMLAIKAVLARNEDTPLLVFDEVDANVGGEVANRVGAQMRLIAADRQVLCISHLPQVAAAAHHHYCVAKEVCDDRTFARIYPLDEETRVEELARMLGGKDTTSVVMDHAQELIAAHG